VKAVVVYESMYGNTHLIADAVADGLREPDAEAADVVVVPVEGARPDVLAGVDLLVVGGPTHAHGMSHASTRRAAVEATVKPGSDLVLDDDAEGPGLRDWFASLAHGSGPAAAFDTRIDAPPAITGRASKGIARKLRHHGYSLVADPMSFLVTKQQHLEPHEQARAREWGARLAASVGSRAPSS
jgi:hypothetical protein